MRGADAVRPNRWRARFWGAAMRLTGLGGRDPLLAPALRGARGVEAREPDLQRAVLAAGVGMFGVLFVAVAARIVGIVGVSPQPTSPSLCTASTILWMCVSRPKLVSQ